MSGAGSLTTCHFHPYLRPLAQRRPVKLNRWASQLQRHLPPDGEAGRGVRVCLVSTSTDLWADGWAVFALDAKAFAREAKDALRD